MVVEDDRMSDYVMVDKNKFASSLKDYISRIDKRIEIEELMKVQNIILNIFEYSTVLNHYSKGVS